jgi:5-methyltetrahydropteroyltriglutamate--homocysteine methyltransferase
VAVVHLGLTSPFPRPEEIISASREFDRGRVTADALDALYRKWGGKVLELEVELGFSTVLGGLLSQQDLFRPFSEETPGLEVGPLTRWFETNTFFRQPIVNAPPQWAPGAFARRLSLPELNATKIAPRVILPGPYTFSGLADNRTDLSREELARRWSELLALEVHDLAAHGVRSFQVQEPLLVVDPPSRDEQSWVERAFEPLAPALSEVESILWTFFGDGAPVLPLLAALPFETVGVDLTETDPALLTELPAGKGLGLGCLDSRTTLVEDPEDIAALVRELDARLQPSEVLLGPGLSLELVPWEVAERKLRVLAAARKLLEGTGAKAPTKAARAGKKAPAAARKAPAKKGAKRSK